MLNDCAGFSTIYPILDPELGALRAGGSELVIAERASGNARGKIARGRGCHPVAHDLNAHIPTRLR